MSQKAERNISLGLIAGVLCYLLCLGRFGVTHRSRHIAVDRPEIALAVDERQAHREILRQAHERHVDRLVAVRVVVTHHFADGLRALAIGLVVRVPGLIHRVEDAPVHRLQTVARIRQSARDDDAHRIVEIRALQLVFDANELYALRECWSAVLGGIGRV